MTTAERINKLRESYLGGLKSLADEIREKNIIPVCLKHNLTYNKDKGNFYSKDGKYVGPEDNPDVNQVWNELLFEVEEVEVTHIWSLIENVFPEELTSTLAYIQESVSDPDQVGLKLILVP
jgi:hypothetical protein